MTQLPGPTCRADGPRGQQLQQQQQQQQRKLQRVKEPQGAAAAGSGLHLRGAPQLERGAAAERAVASRGAARGLLAGEHQHGVF